MFWFSLFALAITAGCQSPIGVGAGELTVVGEDNPGFARKANYDTAVYRHLGPGSAEILLIEGDIDNPRQVIHLKMFWRPLAGRTPFDAEATNTTVRYLNFTGQNAGLYRGGGFLFPKTKPGENLFEGELRNASLRLAEHTLTFPDRPDGSLLGRLISATGTFTARRDDLEVERLLRRVRLLFDQHLQRQRVSDRSMPTRHREVG
jgi:hypothetical protein